MKTIKTWIGWIDVLIHEGLPLKSITDAYTGKTYLFSVSISAKTKKIADNFLYKILDYIRIEENEIKYINNWNSQ